MYQRRYRRIFAQWRRLAADGGGSARDRTADLVARLGEVRNDPAEQLLAAARLHPEAPGARETGHESLTTEELNSSEKD